MRLCCAPESFELLQRNSTLTHVRGIQHFTNFEQHTVGARDDVTNGYATIGVLVMELHPR